MEYKSNLKYFKQNIKPLIAGIVFLVIGVVVKLIFNNEHSWEIRQIYIAFLLIGAICVVMFLVMRPKDADLDGQIATFISGDEDVAKEKAAAADKRGKVVESFVLADYARDRDDCMVYRGADGTVRTNWYSSSVIVLTTHHVCIYRRQFSITEECVNEEFFTIDYADIVKCCIDSNKKEYVFGKRIAIQEISHFNIEMSDKIFSLTTHSDSFVDEFCERLNRKVDALKESE